MLITSVTAQVTPLDSNNVKMTMDELKFVTSVFIDYLSLKEVHAKEVEKVGVLERIIRDKLQLIGLKDETIELLKRRIEIMTPAWYDHFYIGFGSAVIIFVCAIILI